MPNQFTPAQIEIIDAFWEEHAPFMKGKKIRKGLIVSVAIQCWDVGPREGVSAQTIGALYANRLAALESRPRARQKTPEQLEMLRELWEKDPYPYPGESILIVYESGLKKTQVSAWFDNERKKVDERGEELYTQHPRINPNIACRMWRAYKKNPVGYADKLRSGVISLISGERLRGEA